MTKLSRAVIACISAIMMLPGWPSRLVATAAEDRLNIRLIDVIDVVA